MFDLGRLSKANKENQIRRAKENIPEGTTLAYQHVLACGHSNYYTMEWLADPNNRRHDLVRCTQCGVSGPTMLQASEEISPSQQGNWQPIVDVSPPVLMREDKVDDRDRSSYRTASQTVQEEPRTAYILQFRDSKCRPIVARTEVPSLIKHRTYGGVEMICTSCGKIHEVMAFDEVLLR